MVAARHLGEARVAERRDRLRPALEGEHVHVRHRAVRLHVVDRLGEGRALQRQAAHAPRLEEPEDAGGEADLAERPDEIGAPPVGEGLDDRGRPRRPIPLDHAEEQPGNSLIARGLRQLLGGDAVREGRERAGGGEVPQQGPRL